MSTILSITAAMLMNILEYLLRFLKCNVQNAHIHIVQGACAIVFDSHL